MEFFNKTKEFVIKLRSLPENQKKIILFTIVIISALIIGFFTLISTKKNISKIGESLKLVNLSQTEILPDQESNNNQSDVNNPGLSVEPDSQKLPEDGLSVIGNVGNTTTSQNTETSQSLSKDLVIKDWNTYKNEKYKFIFNYPKDWIIDDKKTTDLELWLEKKVSPEVADVHLEVASETMKIKTALEGIDVSISQMRDIITPKKDISIGNYVGYEAIGTICTKICNGSEADVYSPFSIIYFYNSDTNTVIKIKYGEGILDTGWKNTIEEWKFYNEYKDIISTFEFNK